MFLVHAGLRAVFPCTNMVEQAQDAEGDPKRDRAESCGQAPGKSLLRKSHHFLKVLPPLERIAYSRSREKN